MRRDYSATHHPVAAVHEQQSGFTSTDPTVGCAAMFRAKSSPRREGMPRSAAGAPMAWPSRSGSPGLVPDREGGHVVPIDIITCPEWRARQPRQGIETVGVAVRR